jgi:hypothetical protein
MTQQRHPQPRRDMQDGAHLALEFNHNWRLVSTLWLLTAIPGLPAILIVLLVMLGPVESTMLMSLINPNYFSSPLAVLVHGSSSVAFFLTMPWQFSPALRHQYPTWHRRSGRVVILSGFIMAISGVWMHLSLTPDELGMRFIGLVVVSSGIMLALAMALYAVLQRQFERHRRWMFRAVAITLAVVTPLFIEVLATLTLGQVAAFKPWLAPFLHDYDRLVGLCVNLLIVQRLLREKVVKKAHDVGGENEKA